VDVAEWKKELDSIREHYKKFGDRLPKELIDELDGLEKRLNAAK
jgi:phosphoenolpyruvate carboxykinase (GTP)